MPCNDYVTTIHDKSTKHSVKKCEKCSKGLRWIQLCKRADSQLQQLSDIRYASFICSKHFANKKGPTEMDPDPYPASKVRLILVQS